MGEAYASACALILKGFDATGKDFEEFGMALQTLAWGEVVRRPVWAADGGTITMRVGEIKANEEEEHRLEKPTASFGLHRVAIKSSSSTCPSSYPLVLILQLRAAISLNNKPGRQLCIAGFGRWHEDGREKTRELVSIR
jgi:hypothetical protein